MLARTGSQGSGVERIVPVMVLIVELNWVSTWCLWDDLDQTGAQYSAAENARASAEVRRVGAAVPHFESASLLRRLFLDFTLDAVLLRCSLKDRVLSRVTPSEVGVGAYFSLVLLR